MSKEKQHTASLLGSGLDDITISWVGNGQHTHTVQLTTRSPQLHIVARVLVHAGLGKHGIILHL